MMRTDESLRLVKLYLSFFALYKIIILAKKVNRSTLAQIVSPSQASKSDLERILCSMRHSFSSLVAKYIPFVSELPFELGVRWKPTWKALPSSVEVRRWLSSKLRRKVSTKCQTGFLCLMAELQCAHLSPLLFAMYPLLYRSGYIRYPLDDDAERF